MNKLLPLLFILALLGSCSNSKTEFTNPTISLEGLWDEKGYVNLSEVAESIEYVALEKTPECILPGENMLRGKIIGDYLIINSPERSVYIFSKSGKFLFNVGNFGKGPGEFISAKVEFDLRNEIFWILDATQHKLLKFNQEGAFIEEYKVSPEVKRIALHSDGQLFALRLPNRMQPELAEVQLINPEGRVTKTIPLYPNREPGAGDFASITAFFGFVSGRLHFNEGPYREGYHLDENSEWRVSWKLDQGKIALGDEAYYGTGSDSFLDGPAIAAITESRGFLFMYGRKESISKHFVLFKTDMQVKVNELVAETEMTRDMWGMFNDIDGGLPFWPRGNSESNEYVQLYDALRYIELAEGHLKYYGTDKKVPISESLKSLCEKLDPDDNPVAMIVRLRAQGRHKAQGSGLKAQVRLRAQGSSKAQGSRLKAQVSLKYEG